MARFRVFAGTYMALCFIAGMGVMLDFVHRDYAAVVLEVLVLLAVGGLWYRHLHPHGKDKGS